MARGRMISNAIAQDKRINQLMDDTSRLAYTWLITFADCEGRTPGDPAVVRSMLFPRREDITIVQMEGYIRQWSDCGLIIWYEAKEDMWIYFPAFFNHNIVNKTREASSKIPPPPASIVATNSRVTPDQLPIKLNQIKSNQDQVNHNRDDGDSKSNIRILYENSFGFPPAIMDKELALIEKTYPGDWIEQAFDASNKAGARGFSYVRKVLENRKNGTGKGGKIENRDTPEARAKYGDWETK